jgi:hypothetical protein
VRRLAAGGRHRLQPQEAVAGVQRDRLVAEQQRPGAVLDGLRQLPLQHLAGAELEGRELPVRPRR